jgi:hypothetical protein
VKEEEDSTSVLASSWKEAGHYQAEGFHSSSRSQPLRRKSDIGETIGRREDDQ